ncbi:MAG TPA: D-alanyl-D-alanine carboxypeptidase family protein [Bacillota bacterium]
MRARGIRSGLAAVLSLALIASGAMVAAAGPAAALNAPTAAIATLGKSLEIKAPSAILVDAGSGQVLFEKNSHERRAIASMTKLMALELAFEAIETGKVSLQDKVSASSGAYRMGGAQIWLAPGEQMPFEDILRAVAMQSANDASVVVAEHVAGSLESFVAMMNQRAKELGMLDTHYQNPHGIDEADHYSSAFDLAVLGREAVRHSKLLEFTSTWETRIRPDPVSGKGRTWLINTNRLLVQMKGVDGLKTGFTNNSGYCLTATLKRGDLRLISVVMGETEGKLRFDESAKLLSFGFANYSGVPVTKSGEKLGSVTVQRGLVEKVDAVAKADFSVVVPKGQESGLKREVRLARRVTAPVLKGAHLGTLTLTRDGQEVGRVDLVAAASVKRIGYFRLIGRLTVILLRGD